MVGSTKLAPPIFSALAVLEIAWVAFFVVAFGSGLLGLCIVLGAVAAVLLGVVFAGRVWAPPTPSHG